MNKVVERFLKYTAIESQSSNDSVTFPSTQSQLAFASVLYDELVNMGLDVKFNRDEGIVYASCKASEGCENRKALGFIAHLDTSPEVSGKDVKANVIENYDGKDIVLNREKNIILSRIKYPEITAYKGKTIITTDGTTLLGADDKAGVAEIITMFEELLAHPEIKHGKITAAFTPDEEVGGGIDHLNIKKFGADYAYTVDGGEIGEIQYENFNAASAKVIFSGVNVHTGEAKNKMVNSCAVAMEYNAMLPSFEKPEYTEGYEGFIHLEEMKGNVEKTVLSYLIRDHAVMNFEQKKDIMRCAEDYINSKYGEDTCEVIIENSYQNMKDKIFPQNMFLIENVEKYMIELGIDPKIVPIRGGTDGAKLSFRGIPCPNICTGGHNFHGRYEYVCAESMQLIVELLCKLAENFDPE